MLALFDIDGTLLLAGGAGARTLALAFGELYGIDDAMQGIRCSGKTDPAIVTEMFQAALDRPPREDELQRLLGLYESMLPDELQRSSQFRLMPHVHETLDALSERPEVVLGIATGNTIGGARAKLSHADLEHRFAVGGYGSDHHLRDRLVARAIERGNEHAARSFGREEVVVIGDTPRDVSAAHDCGIRAVAVCTGFHERPELEASGADAVIDTLESLHDALGSLGL